MLSLCGKHKTFETPTLTSLHRVEWNSQFLPLQKKKKKKSMPALTICSQVYSSGTSSFSSTETAPLWSFNILLALGRGRWDHSYIVRGFIWEVGYQHFSPCSKERALHSPLPYSFKSLLFFFFLHPLSFFNRSRAASILHTDKKSRDTNRVI